MKRFQRSAVVLAAMVLAASVAVADVPQLINYQGRLTNDQGDPLNGTYGINFTIYNDCVVGDSLWSSGNQYVEVTEGLFTYKLGSITPLPNDLFETDTVRCLGIAVQGGLEMTPRIKMISVAYAYQALRADSAQYAALATSVPPGSIGVTEINLSEVQLRVDTACPQGYYISEINEDGSVVCVEDQAGSGNWSVTDSVLYTNNYWGIARGGADNAVYGDSMQTMVNLGVACTTGVIGSTGSYMTISGGFGNNAVGKESTVGGGIMNHADSIYCTVGGGRLNQSRGFAATVAGGVSNWARGAVSTVGGGDGNRATNHAATVSGGGGNQATGEVSTVGGGVTNRAEGLGSTVPGGETNIAVGDYSFAAGTNVYAEHDGAFVWSANSGYGFGSTAAYEFAVQSTGGVRFVTGRNPSVGAQLLSGSGSWSSISDINVKNNIEPINGLEILRKVAILPISTWNYKTQDASIHHIGPMAQDFSAVFGVGENDTHISTVDADGIALAAIQALLEKVERLEQRIVELESQDK